MRSAIMLHAVILGALYENHTGVELSTMAYVCICAMFTVYAAMDIIDFLRGD